MSDTSTYTDVFVIAFEQLIIGRYNAENNINLIHLSILGGLFTLMMFVYIIFLQSRLNKYQEDKLHIPPERLPLMKEDMGRHMFNVMLNEVLFVDNVISTRPKLKPETNEHCGDPGWGDSTVDDARDEVHYNTSIAKSFYILESTALSRRPGLFHRKSQTIRDYLGSLQKAFPSLHSGLCQEYIHTYERAVFGEHVFTQAEFVRFRTIISILVEMINENQHTTDTSI
jgi:hypothetical protein